MKGGDAAEGDRVENPALDPSRLQAPLPSHPPDARPNEWRGTEWPARRRRRRREFAAQSERGPGGVRRRDAGARRAGPRARVVRAARRRGARARAAAGRPRHGGGGRGGHALHNPAAAALRAPRAAQAARPRAAVAGLARPTPPRLRPSALGPLPGDAGPVPPRPHRRPRGRSPSALPQTTMPGHGRLLRPRGPGRRRRHRRRRTVPSLGAGKRAEGKSRTAAPRSTLATRSPGPVCARSAAAVPLPLQRERAPQLRPGPPLPLRWPARSQAPPRPAAARPARAAAAIVPAPARTTPGAAHAPVSSPAPGDPTRLARRPSPARPQGARLRGT